MGLKQISLCMPEQLFEASKKYTEAYGYKNLQELLLELLRKKVLLDNIERYRQIEAEMKAGKNVKRLSKAGAVKYLESL